MTMEAATKRPLKRWQGGGGGAASRKALCRLADPEATLGRLTNFAPPPEDLEPFDAMWHDLLAWVPANLEWLGTGLGKARSQP